MDFEDWFVIIIGALFIILVCVFVICGCGQGEEGIMGPQGPPGVQGQGQASIIQIATGVLTSDDIIEDGDALYWAITIPEQYVSYNRWIWVCLWGVVFDDWYYLTYGADFMFIQDFVLIFYGVKPDDFNSMMIPDVTRYKIMLII